MTLYKGSQKIRDTGTYGVYHGRIPIRSIYHGSDLVYWQQISHTFNVSDSFQTYTVPHDVHKLRVDCVASQGFQYSTSAAVGKGGRVQCDLTVTPNQVLYIVVGKAPTDGGSAVYNASDIRTNNAGVTDSTSLNSRLIVAGGGGSTGTSSANGGAGGGLTGGTGGTDRSGGGTGGTQSAGGTGGRANSNFGADGGPGVFGLGHSGDGTGAGGAGWYGGGSGGASAEMDWRRGGGGGGSSYTSSACSNVSHTQGYRDGAGYITITEIE